MAPWLQDWVKERVGEQVEHLKQQGEGAGPARPLFRERRGPPPELAQPALPSLAPLVRAVRPGVVNVSAREEGSERRSLGSGFILNPEGLVVTNHHVVARVTQVLLKLFDGRELEAAVIGRDPSTDLALLAVAENSVGELPFVYLGDSDALSVGDWVVAIGNPFGLGQSVSHGMISAKERVIGVGLFDDFIQTDALINPGNSGGPLFNLRGEVVGVNTAIVAQSQGIGFAVPINMVKDLLPNLRANGRLTRGWLGVSVQEHPDEEARGAVISDVYQESPAAVAGVLPGDRVTRVNGKPIEGYLQMLRKVAVLGPGARVTLTVERGGQGRELSARLTERPNRERLPTMLGEGAVPALGVVLAAPDDEPGLRIVAVIARSPASKAGVLVGERLLEVDREPVRDVMGLRRLMAQRSASDGPVLLKLGRRDRARYISVTPAAP